ncbi:hypothetical protein QQZ08_003839 [Neonectria magnoliae]|uniref:Uncharacterized protein n=1 Tax=Neonectria magnoliae TaxID=2732573 RepID=A0ABR1I8U3_9HYPO
MAGSITPVLTKSNFNTTFQILDYSESTSDFWAGKCDPATPCDELLGKTSDLGTFTFVAWKTKAGLLLNSVEQASARDLSTPHHWELDNIGFTYHGRSYGVASAVGLVGPMRTSNTNQATLLNYTFLEEGYLSNVSCQYNRSSLIGFNVSNVVETPGGIYGPQGVWAQGSLPNGERSGFPTWVVVNRDFVTALAAVNSSSQGMYGFVAGEAYQALNQTQCEVVFTPTQFSVTVDMAAKNISVTPVEGDSNGNLVLHNINNVQSQKGRTGGIDSDAITGIEEGLELLLDHFLGNSGSAQVMLLNETKLVDTAMTLEVVRFGKSQIAYVALGTTAVIFIAAVAEAVRTKVWRDLPPADYLDLKFAIVGMAKDKGIKPHGIKNWGGDPDYDKVGLLRVQRRDTGSLGFVL